MDDSRLSNLLFLAGIASLAIPGCSGSGEPGDAPGSGPPGNPLASQNSLGVGDASDACLAFVSKVVGCADYSDDDDYNSGGYYGLSVAPGYADYCDSYVAALESYGGPGCLKATVDYYSCLSGLSCLELGRDDSACNGAFASLETGCGLGGGGVEDDGE